MWTTEKTLFKRPNFDKLVEYGFVKDEKCYVYAENIVYDFLLQIFVSVDGVLTVKVFDPVIDEEYTPIHSADAVGAFVGAVRSAVEDVVGKVVDSCFDVALHSQTGLDIMDYIQKTYAVDPEHLFDDLPSCAVFRKEKSRRWFAILQTIDYRKTGIERDGKVEILNVKDTPENVQKYVDKISCFPGYHMNKKHWLTIPLDGRLPVEEIVKHLDVSYNVVK